MFIFSEEQEEFDPVGVFHSSQEAVLLQHMSHSLSIVGFQQKKHNKSMMKKAGMAVIEMMKEGGGVEVKESKIYYYNS